MYYLIGVAILIVGVVVLDRGYPKVSLVCLVLLMGWTIFCHFYSPGKVTRVTDTTYLGEIAVQKSVRLRSGWWVDVMRIEPYPRVDYFLRVDGENIRIDEESYKFLKDYYTK